jgi:hypothetical protein
MTMPYMVIPGMKLPKGKKSKKAKEVEIHPGTGLPMEAEGTYTEEQLDSFFVRWHQNSAGTISTVWANVTAVDAMDEDGKPVLNEWNKQVRVASLDPDYKPETGDVPLRQFMEERGAILREMQNYLDANPECKILPSLHKDLKWAKRVGLIPTPSKPIKNEAGKVLKHIRLTNTVLDRDGNTVPDPLQCRFTRVGLEKSYGQAQSGNGCPEFVQRSIL